MPPITEEQLYEAFGLTPPQEQGESEQEPAAPAAEENPGETAEGERAQEIAAPAAEEPQQPEETRDADGGEREDPGKSPMSEQQRRANAARRRQQEQQAAIQAAVQAERDRQAAVLNEVFGKAGLKNTFTGEAITNLDQFQAWNQQFADQKLQQELKAGKLTVESLQQVVSQHPAVQQAQQLIEQQQAQQRAQQEAADRARIEGELAQIAQLDPTVKSVADILQMPTAAAFRGYVAKGHSFLDAFKLANMESIAAARAEKARQETLNNARGKDHLKAPGNARGGGAAAVPPDQMALFRQMMPGASEAQIQKYYNSYLSRKGG